VRALLLICVTAGCGPDSFGAKAIELGIVPQSAAIQGRDGGESGVVFGHSVWVYGDTVLNVNDAEGTNWHHNSYSITDDLVGKDGVSGFSERTDSAGAPEYFIAPTADEATFNDAHRGDPCMTQPCGARWAVWPGRPVWDADRSRAIIFYGLIYAEPGDYNFHSVGQSVALWSDFARSPERPILSTGDHPTLLFQQNEPEWGTTALMDSGMLYVFSCHGDNLAPACYLAQVPPESVTDRSTWKFWNGAWSPSMDQKSELFTGAPTISVAFNQHLKKFAAIYCEPLSNHVVIRTAAALTGPWSDARLLFDAKKDPEGAYDSNWHSELDDGADLYVTFSRSNHMGWFGGEFALVRVTLP
jgi:hypothetical protein